MKISVEDSRIIGIANISLLPEMATRLGLAIGSYFGKGSVLATARDFRKDSRMIKRSLSGGLMSAGIDVLDLHAASTSTLQFIVRRFGASGGISYTGAHYLGGEISIRILDNTGNEIEDQTLEEIISILESEQFNYVSYDDLGVHESIENSGEVYLRALKGFINWDLISSKKLKIVLDCSLGPSGRSISSLLNELKIDVVSLNAHQIASEAVLPTPRSIVRVSKTITAIGADFGVIIDAEGTKLVVLDDNGKIIPPEDIIALLIYLNLQKRDGAIILSKLFTKQFDSAFKSLNGRVVRVEDTPGNIGRQITNERAVLGATDNGKLYNPVWGAETDGTLSTLTLIEELVQRDIKLSTLMNEFRDKRSQAESVSQMILKIPLPDAMSQLDFFKLLLNKSAYFNRDTLIGVKIEIESGFIHYITSLKENELEVIIETTKLDELPNLQNQSHEIIEQITTKLSPN